ncbi:MAG: hypothetical protein ACRCSQ_06525 [Bacteroidales bacterium]
MKKRSLFSIIGFVMALLFTYSCSSDETTGTDVNAKGEISFELTFPEPESKADPIFKTPCYDMPALQGLATSGKLIATFELQLSGSTTVTPYTIKIGFYNGKFIADPIALSLGTYAVNSFIVKDNEGSTLYAAPMNNSQMAQYVPTGFTLPFNLVVGQGDLYQKTIRPVWVVCAEHVTAQQFGYIMWDINFFKLLCIPFSVNVCDVNGTLIPGAGTLKIYQDANFTDTQYTEGNINPISTTNFPNGTSFAEFCIPDLLSVANDKEYYKFVITTTKDGQPHTYTGFANVTTLLQYTTSDAWNATNKRLDFNFCSCSPRWFFPCDPSVPASGCINRLRFVEGGSATGGNDDFLEFWSFTSPTPPFNDYTYLGWGNISKYDTNTSNGVFTLKNGLLCRSINSVPYSVNNKIMKIVLSIEAKEAGDLTTDIDLFKIMFFDNVGNYIGRFPFVGKRNVPYVDLIYQFDQLALIDKSGNSVSLTPGKCYRVGIETYKNATWTLDFQRFWVQTQGPSQTQP